MQLMVACGKKVLFLQRVLKRKKQIIKQTIYTIKQLSINLITNLKSNNKMKKMNNYQAPMAEVIEINIVSPVLNASDVPTPPTPGGGGGGGEEE